MKSLLKDLKVAIPFWHGQARNLIDGRVGTVDNTGAAGTASEIAPRHRGFAYDTVWNGSPSDVVFIDFGLDEYNFDGASGLTIAGWMYPKSHGQNNDGRIMDHDGMNTGNSQGYSFGVNNSPTNCYRLGINATSTNWEMKSATNAWVTDKWQFYTVTWESGVEARYYTDGVLISTNTSVYSGTINGTGLSGRPSREWLIAARAHTDNLRTWDGYLGPMMLWDRTLTDVECRALAGDPYQLFRRRGIFIPGGVAAAAGGPVTADAGIAVLDLSSLDSRSVTARAEISTIDLRSLDSRSVTARAGIATLDLASLDHTARVPVTATAEISTIDLRSLDSRSITARAGIATLVVDSLDVRSVTARSEITTIDLLALDASATIPGGPPAATAGIAVLDLASLDSRSVTARAEISTINLRSLDSRSITARAEIATLDLSSLDAEGTVAVTATAEIATLDLRTLDARSVTARAEIATLDLSSFNATGPGVGVPATAGIALFDLRSLGAGFPSIIEVTSDVFLPVTRTVDVSIPVTRTEEVML